MKKTLKGYLLGFISATLLVSCITVFATNTTTLYDVIANGVKIVVDGQKLNPADANGNAVEPLIYNGTTYLPVRAVANALGKAVYWDGPNYTVYLGDMNGRLNYPTITIDDMVSIGDEPRTVTDLTDNYGNTYMYAIGNSNSVIELEYLLNMKYSNFKGTLYVPKGTTNDGSWYVTIIADGKRIYKSPEMTKASAPIEVDVNIKGYNDVKIEMSDYSNAYSWEMPTICIGDAGFYQ